MLLIQCVLLRPLFCGDFMYDPWFVVQYLVSFQFCNYLAGDERDIALLLLPLMSFDC